MTNHTLEFSRPLHADHVSPKGTEQELEAKPAERAALAKRFDLVELKRLKAHLSLQAGREETVAVTGKITADLVQSCVVTLEPITSHLSIDVDVTFIPVGQHREGAGSPHIDDGDDDFEVFHGGKIDLGEMVAQHLGINLDPYPRKPNAAVGAIEVGAKATKANPFAQLASLPKKPKK